MHQMLAFIMPPKVCILMSHVCILKLVVVKIDKQKINAVHRSNILMCMIYFTIYTEYSVSHLLTHKSLKERGKNKFLGVYNLFLNL